MRSLIIHYSFSGNTKKAAGLLQEYLAEKCQVDALELKDLRESGKFFTQAAQAFRHAKADIPEVSFDLSGYDLICFGTPVWAFGPAPAMNTYLDKCFGITDKNVVLFTTYGSGTGNQRCLDYMQNALAKKGAKNFKEFSIQQFKLKNPDFVREAIQECLKSG